MVRKLIVLLFSLFILTGCSMEFGQSDEHECSEFEERINVNVDDILCGKTYEVEMVCTVCGKINSTKIITKDHELITEIVNPTCVSDGYEERHCKNCDYVYYHWTLSKTGEHDYQDVIIDEAHGTSSGIKGFQCKMCGEIISTTNYYVNGYYNHGKLSVSGADLVDQNGEKFQLVGLSTHGIQWFGKYVNFDTFEAIHTEFLNNVFRISLYTSENGYCVSPMERKEELYQIVVRGIKAATSCDCYVIVDWHMLGADDVNDKNPLYYLDEAKEFFRRISLEFKDYDNILYEIMNEPCGTTTWADCKKYAEAIIPLIRKNSDAVILVGNPKWSADLASVMKNPLTGFKNIMYTFHFYANDSFNQKRLTDAYDAGFPVFVSEHGGMEASGDGAISYTSIAKWYTEMDKRNISYVAWNISNSKGSASIILQNDPTMTDFSDQHLKEWGIYYKTITRGRLMESE